MPIERARQTRAWSQETRAWSQQIQASARASLARARSLRGLVFETLRQRRGIGGGSDDYGLSPDRAAAYRNGLDSKVLASVEPEPVSWLWPGRIARGKLNLIIGEPGVGKTFFYMDLAARITRGMPWPDGGDAPVGSVLMVTSEDGLADTLRPRLDLLGGDPARVIVARNAVTMDEAHPFSLETDLTQLRAELAQRPEIIMTAFDPLSAYLGARDSYKDAEIREILTPLAALAEEANVALLGILHLTKAAQRRILMRAQGSIAFVAQARVVLAVGLNPDDENERVVVTVKNNLVKAPPALSFRLDNGLAWGATPRNGKPEELLAQDEPESRSMLRERREAMDFLQRELANGPVSSTTVKADARACGIAERTLFRAKRDVGVQTDTAKDQQGRARWFWRWPTDEERITHP